MGFSRNTIYQALQEPENNQIKVAYQLVVDYKRIVVTGGISGQKSFLEFPSGKRYIDYGLLCKII